MIEKVVETWHRFLAGELPEALDGLLADESPIVGGGNRKRRLCGWRGDHVAGANVSARPAIPVRTLPGGGCHGEREVRYCGRETMA